MFGTTLTVSDWIDLVGVIIAIIALIISVEAIRRPLRQTLFSDYAKRFSKIMQRIPPEFFIADGEKLSKILDEHLLEIEPYFDLCWEEYFLNKRHHVDRAVWKDWKEGIETNMSKVCFQMAWLRLKDSFRNMGFKRMLISKLNFVVINESGKMYNCDSFKDAKKQYDRLMGKARVLLDAQEGTSISEESAQNDVTTLFQNTLEQKSNKQRKR